MNRVARLVVRFFRALGRDPRQRSLLAVLLLFLSLGALHALVVPPLAAIDERVHFSYALEVRDGKLPQIDTPVRAQVVGLTNRPERNTIWVANHPPLFYALQAVVIGDVQHALQVPAAVTRGRLLSLLFACAGLWSIFSCLRQLSAPKSKLPILVVALLAVVPQFTHVSAFIHNDSLALAATGFTLYTSVLILERGLSLRLYTLALLGAALSVAVRLSGAMIALVPVAVVAFVAYRDTAGSRVRRALRGVVLVSGITVAIGLTSGWFYARNYALYGELSGTTALLQKFGRQPQGNLFELIVRPQLWWGFVEQLWGFYANNTRLLPTTLRAPAIVAVLGCAGLFIALLGLRGTALTQARANLSQPRGLGVALLALLTTLTLVSIFAFHSRGGSAHARYLFPVLWCLLAPLAAGLLRLGSVVACASFLALLVNHLLALDSFVARAYALHGRHLKDLLLASPRYRSGIEPDVTAVLLLAICVGSALLIGYLFDVERRREPRSTPWREPP